ncbi:energy transducer TonB [Mucilaginibacter sp.]|uniref:energy transducer TonB n=1 Tax=Mucilaginibacter sp. TaxID=1882438 RepID=UPI003AFF6835
MKPKFYYASFIACFLVLNGFAQKQNVYFLKNDGRYVDLKDSADFVRIVREPDSGSVLYNVMEYYPNGNMKMIGKSAVIEPVVLEGTVLSFYPNKTRKQIANYIKGNPTGDCYDYYPNGKLYRFYSLAEKFSAPSVFHFISSEKIVAIYDSAGVSTALSGNGYYRVYDDDFTRILEEGKVKNGKRDSVWTGFAADGKILYQEEFAKGKFARGRRYSPGGDIKTYKVEEALPRFSIFSMSGSTSMGTLGYPGLGKDLQGIMIIQFTIDTNGSFSDLKILKSITQSLDGKVLSTLKRMPRFHPATQHGTPVKVNYTMPINIVSK